MQTLISLENVTVTRNGNRLLGPLSWQVERGGHTVIAGSNGAGKTTLMRLLRGELTPDRGGDRYYDFGEGRQRTPLGLRQRIGMVSADMQEFYFLHTPRLPGRNMILAGFYDTPILYAKSTPEQEAQVDEIIDWLGVQELAERALGTLSTGQVRKLLIARGLASHPDILLLDECLDGLDMVSRFEVLSMLEKAGERTTLLCAAHRAGDVPRCIERALVLDKGTVAADGPLSEAGAILAEKAPRSVSCELPVSPPPPMEFLLRMKNVAVVADGTRILDDIYWTVLPGENWIVMGQNGAGKSTLLKLITSEIAPYADEDKGVGSIERLGGMTMDQARPRIGVVSPDLQITYGRELAWEVTAEEVVMSGYRGSVGMLDQPTDKEMQGAALWLEAVGLSDLADRPLRHMSYGQQRRVFLARAMAPGPDLLILDEPFSGLDSDSRAIMLDLVGRVAKAGTPLILVTHNVEDRFPSINRVMTLEKGRQQFCGTRDEYEISVVMG